MLICRRANRGISFALAMTAVALLAIVAAPAARAQFINQQVGGVSIDSKGIVDNVRLDQLNELKRARQQAMQAVPDDLKIKSLRKVSLRGLEAAIAEHQRNGTPLSDDVRYLAGLQRIQYVFVYPDQHDVVLAGPGEGWKLNAQGEVVGVTTNRPVMLLDDLLVALRSWDMVRQTGITCSIDPTSEGLARLSALYENVGPIGANPEPVMAAAERELGLQTVTINGVPSSSHFARVLLAADYRMKRIAMGFEESPLAALPSFMDMLQRGGKSSGSMLPRWWLEPQYGAITKDADGLAWEIPAGSVKAMTEEDLADAAGKLQRGVGKNPLAKKWADTMTAQYDKLSEKDAIFGQLRNCMELAVVSALIATEQLNVKTGWTMETLLNPAVQVESYHAPKHLHSRASLVQRGSDWIISTSGGVQIVPWEPLQAAKTSSKPIAARDEAAANRDGKWWWN